MPYSLVVVNILALGAIGYLGGVFAANAERHVLWGLLLPGFFGLWFSLGRDLTEPVGRLLLGALLALRRERPVIAGLLLAYAVVTGRPLWSPWLRSCSSAS